MRSDGMLPYEFVEDSSSAEVTGHAGLLPYYEYLDEFHSASEEANRVARIMRSPHNPGPGSALFTLLVNNAR